jgi:aspartate aminotransferase
MSYRPVAKSGTLALNEQMRALEAAGQTVYRFGFGESPFSPLLGVQAALADATGRTEYAPVKGLPELCDRVAAFHSAAHGPDIRGSQVYVAPGSKPLLFATVASFARAQVFIPAPAWVSYGPQARLMGHEACMIPADYENRWRVTPDALADAVAPHADNGAAKLLVLNYPGNPDGLSYTGDELAALADVLRKYEMWVLSDEIYGLLDHAGAHESLLTYYPERTVVTTGLSKWAGAGGWRFGAAILPQDAPREFTGAFVGVASEIYSCAPTPVQVAAMAAYVWNDETRQFVDDQRAIIGGVGATLHRQLIDEGVRVHAPTGAFYMLLDFSAFKAGLAAQGVHDDLTLCSKLLEETGVALLPGTAFGMPPGALTARMAYVDFDGDAARSRLANGVEAASAADTARMTAGIAALCDWLRGFTA